MRVVLVIAAVIDGWKLKVPNWITFPLILGGWIYSTACFGWEGLGWSLLGTIVGLALLLPAYAIGGMGAGDVKLLAGVGAWVLGATRPLCVLRLGGRRRRDCRGDGPLAPRLAPSPVQFWTIINEILTIRDPESAVGDCGRAQELDAAVALRNSDCHRLNCLFCLGGNVTMKEESPNIFPRQPANRSRTRTADPTKPVRCAGCVDGVPRCCGGGVALVAPVFLLMVLGMLEIGRVLMVQQILTNASREGARRAVLDGATAADVKLP